MSGSTSTAAAGANAPSDAPERRRPAGHDTLESEDYDPQPEDGDEDETEELAELQSMLGSQASTRPNAHSHTSVAKYNHWRLVEANRQLGIQMREEEAALQRRREQSTAAYHAARKAKTSVGRGQMELTTGAVREYRGQLAIRGAAGKAECETMRAKAMRQKAEWAAHGSRNAQLHGAEQKKRVLESRAERFQARRNAALAGKQENDARKAVARADIARALAEKKLRMERTRDGLPTPETIAEAREFFAKQKRESAAEVRRNERDWLLDRKRDESLILERAAMNRTLAMNSRKAAASNRASCVELRNQAAKEMKSRAQTLETQRKQLVLATVMNSKSSHQDLYDNKYVNDETSSLVNNSDYGLLLQRTRFAGRNVNDSTATDSSRPNSAK